jgi:alkylation response protein AidB-like acyl-CoA dehydrogenase
MSAPRGCETCGGTLVTARPPKTQARACSYWCELVARGTPGFTIESIAPLLDRYQAPSGQLAFDLEVPERTAPTYKIGRLS